LEEFLVEDYADAWDENDEKCLKNNPINWDETTGKALFDVSSLEQEGGVNMSSFVVKTRAAEYSVDRSKALVVSAAKLHKHFQALAGSTREMSSQMRVTNLGITITDSQAFLLHFLLQMDKRYVTSFMDIPNQQQCVLFALPMFEGPPPLVLDLTPREFNGRFISSVDTMRVYTKEQCPEEWRRYLHEAKVSATKELKDDLKLHPILVPFKQNKWNWPNFVKGTRRKPKFLNPNFRLLPLPTPQAQAEGGDKSEGAHNHRQHRFQRNSLSSMGFSSKQPSDTENKNTESSSNNGKSWQNSGNDVKISKHSLDIKLAENETLSSPEKKKKEQSKLRGRSEKSSSRESSQTSSERKGNGSVMMRKETSTVGR
jgi:hypothetical protein